MQNTVILNLGIIVLIVGLAIVAVLITKNIQATSKAAKENRETAERQMAKESELAMMISEARKETIETTANNIKLFGDTVAKNQKLSIDSQKETLEEMSQRLDRLTKEVASQLEKMYEGNTKQLENIRATVDEKLQKTLEERIAKSFNNVQERLEAVHKGLGEMKTLAGSVGDLKNILSRTKTRGIVGEIQLAAILEQVLAPEQYVENFEARKGKRVEFAIKMPGASGTNDFVYLPIDSKFPSEKYERVKAAYEAADKAEIEKSIKELRIAIKEEARKIHQGYVNPPLTTDFAVMFLPTEGLYAEVIRTGVAEEIQREYKIMIAGPMNMAALLNSLQMGFKTLAIQKRSGEVWDILAKTKKEFENFEGLLSKVQKKIIDANSDLEKLVGVRTRQINRALKDVEAPTALLEDTNEADIIGDYRDDAFEIVQEGDK